MLAEALKCEHLTSVVDIGASPIDGEPPYKAMHEAGLCRVLGFEPQKKWLDELLKTTRKGDQYVPTIIGNGSPRHWHHCFAAGMSGLFAPDQDVLKCFPKFSEWGRVEYSGPTETNALDSFNYAFDLLKIDIQGGELDAFDGADRGLQEAVAVHTEVSFVPLYVNQPIFGEVDIYLRACGFLPHHFAGIKRWPIAPAVSRTPNQLLEADIVYVRDFTKMDKMTDEQIRQLAMISHYCYGSHDLVVRCLHFLKERGVVDGAIIPSYIASVAIDTE